MSNRVKNFVRDNVPLYRMPYAVLFQMADRSGDDGIVTSSHADGAVGLRLIAFDARLSQRQVRRIVAGLERAGILERLALGRGRGGRAIWRIVMEPARWSERLRAALPAFARRVEQAREAFRLINSVPKHDILSGFPAENRTSRVGKHDIGDTENRTSATREGVAIKDLYSEHLRSHYTRTGPHARSVDKLTAEKRRKRPCTHTRCEGLPACRYGPEPVGDIAARVLAASAAPPGRGDGGAATDVRPGADGCKTPGRK